MKRTTLFIKKKNNNEPKKTLVYLRADQTFDIYIRSVSEKGPELEVKLQHVGSVSQLNDSVVKVIDEYGSFEAEWKTEGK